MNSYEEEQNKVNALKAFNEFVDCVMKANAEHRTTIGNEVAALMIAKFSGDENFNKLVSDVFEVMTVVR